MALFGGACFADRRIAFIVPLTAMLLSDLAIGLLSGDMSLGLHRLIPVVYGSFGLIVCLGSPCARKLPATPPWGRLWTMLSTGRRCRPSPDAGAAPRASRAGTGYDRWRIRYW